MATANDIISKAKSYLGTKEVPANSNNVIFNTHYYGRAVSGQAYPWCCAFVWDIFRMCGAGDLFYNGGKTAYCPSIHQWGVKNKLTVPKSSGTAGDIVLFDFNNNGTADHIGFIECKNSDGSYLTIEGNTAIGNNSNGGEVMRRTRYQSQIIAIIRPSYASGSASASADTDSETSDSNKIIMLGQQHANSFAQCGLAADGIRGAKTKKAAAKVLQRAINLDYKTGLSEDGVFGSKSLKALGNHYVRMKETQYLVTALEILLMLKGYEPNGVECPGIFGAGLKNCVLKYQKDNNLTIDGIAGRTTFISLIN